MIYFCNEILINFGHRVIAGVGHPSSVEIYRVTGNKRVRVGRIIEWEKEYDVTYPRLKFRVTKNLNTLDKNCGWVKAKTQDRLIPYNCIRKR